MQESCERNISHSRLHSYTYGLHNHSESFKRKTQREKDITHSFSALTHPGHIRFWHSIILADHMDNYNYFSLFFGF